MNCELRLWTLDDAADLRDAINNKKVQDNLRDGINYPYTLEDAKSFIGYMTNADKNNEFNFAITARGKAIGSISVTRKENVHRQTAELGYYIAEPYWGQGICTKAVKDICAHVFENTDIIRIFAEPFAYNMASCRVLEKAGFAYEGTLRCNAVKNGQILDMKMYSLIR